MTDFRGKTGLQILTTDVEGNMSLSSAQEIINRLDSLQRNITKLSSRTEEINRHSISRTKNVNTKLEENTQKVNRRITEVLDHANNIGSKIASRIENKEFGYILSQKGKPCPSGYSHVLKKDDCKKFIRDMEKTGISNAHAWDDFNRYTHPGHAYGCFTTVGHLGRVHFNNSNARGQRPNPSEQMVCKRN